MKYRTPHAFVMHFIIYALLLFLLTACQSGQDTGRSVTQVSQTPTSPSTPAPTPSPIPSSTPTPMPSPTAPPAILNTPHPILAFYYMWYTSSSWSSSTMSDLPAATYDSSDGTTIRRQITQASQAGINGFINSWWGQGDVTDTNFTKLLANSALLEGTIPTHFASSLYFESDAPKLQGQTAIVQALTSIEARYTYDPNFLHYNGKPVLFFWDPLGGGRTLNEWAAIRAQVDPGNAMLWSAEGTDTKLLSVFDGLHLFSGAYWGLQHNNAASVDQGFRSQIDQYNQAHGTQKIWAAGVFPGFDDTRVPGRTNTLVVARNNGDTYKQSWAGALASKPDWITITSFNEWFEGSMIEPATDYGALYLTITQQYTAQWQK